MTPLEALSQEDKELITHYIDIYGLNEGEERNANIDFILRFWEQNKPQLFNIFDNELILSKKVTFERGVEELYKECADILDNKCNSFRRNYNNWVEKNFFKEDEKHSWHSSDERYYWLMDLLSINTLAINVYNNRTFEIETPEGKSMKIQNGCKPSKTLGKIAKTFGIEGYEEFRIAHSMALNQKFLKGNLCLSIHPMDYLTMSDNDSDWSSCMSWMDHGCYRMGTVEMMNSPIVVVAYLTAENDMRVPGGYWSNKKWRELYIVTPDIISNVKAYPYRNDAITKEVLNWLKELSVAKDSSLIYTNEIYNYDNDYPTQINELNKEVTICFTTDNMYNDFGNNQLAYFNLSFGSYYENSYSGPSECMACGMKYPDIDSEEDLTGFCCSKKITCPRCGRTFLNDDNFEEIDGEWICDFCVEEDTVYDYTDNLYHFYDEMDYLYISFDGGETIYKTNVMFYRDNFDKEVMGKYFTQLNQFKTDNGFWINTYYFVNIDDITSKGHNLMKEFYYTDLKTSVEDYNNRINSDIITEITVKYLIPKEEVA